MALRALPLVFALAIPAAPQPPPRAPTRVEAVAAVAVLLRLASGRPPAFADMPVGSADRPALGRALKAGLLRGLPDVGRDFHPRAAATAGFLALLAANALRQPIPAGAAGLSLAHRLARAGWPRRQALAIAWAVGEGLLPAASAARPVAAVWPAAYARFLAGLAARVAARRPLALRLRAAVGAVAVGSLDRLESVVLGAGGRPVGLLAGERLAYRVGAAPGGRAAVARAGIFLAARPGRYAVWAVLEGGWAGAGLRSPALGLVAFAPAAALALGLSAPMLVADGRDAVRVTVWAVDRLGDPAVAACTGRMSLSLAGGARIQAPASGAFSLTHLTLPCTLGAARFLVAAPLGSAPGAVGLEATASGVGGLPPGAVARARVEIVAPRASAVALTAAPGPAAGRVLAGSGLTAFLRILDQAGIPLATGRYPFSLVLPAGVTPAPSTPAAYDAADAPAGLALRLTVAAGARPGPRSVRAIVPGVGSATLRLRVLAAGRAGGPLRLAGSLLAAAVPLPALEASTAADPADTAALQVVDAAGAPVPYAGTLAASVTAAATAAQAQGIAASLEAVPGAPGAFQLGLYAGAGGPAPPGRYSVVVAAQAGSPAVAPLSLPLTLVDVAKAAGRGGRAAAAPTLSAPVWPASRNGRGATAVGTRGCPAGGRVEACPARTPGVLAPPRVKEAAAGPQGRTPSRRWYGWDEAGVTR